MSRIQNFWNNQTETNSQLRAQCCGCGACATKCKLNAITMSYDEEGFLYPRIDEGKCIGCGVCENACPLQERQKSSEPYLQVYAGYTKNDTILRQCTSGGFATELALQYIENNGVVVGVAYADDYVKTVYKVATTKEDVLTFSGSKYVQSEKNDIFRVVENELKTSKPVLFVGCPCDIHALNKYLGSDYDNLCTCELVCMGVSTYKLAEDYKKLVEEKEKSKLIFMNARSKSRGWFVPHLEEKYDNGTVKCHTLYGTYLGYGMQVYNRPACFECKFRGVDGSGDIRIGDFWGIKDTDPYWNPNGVCCIFVRTKKGLETIEIMKKTGFELFMADYDQATRGNMSSYKNKPEKYTRMRSKFSRVYKKRGLVSACRATGTISFWSKRIIPERYHQKIKKVYHSLFEWRRNLLGDKE